MNKKGFVKNFFFPELKSIIKKSKFKLIILIITLLLSLIVIGIGNGAKKYVEQRMEDPFIKFMDLKIPFWVGATDKDSWYKYIEEQSVNYNYTPPEAIIEGNRDLSNTETNSTKPSKVFSLNDISPFVKLLTNKTSNERLISRNIDFNNDNFGCIVTEDLLIDIGYNKNEIENISHIAWALTPSGSEIITIPISGIVKSLRNNYKALIPNKSYSFMQKKDLARTLISDTTKLMLFIKDDENWKNEKFNDLRDLGFELVNKEKSQKYKSHIDGIYIEKKYLNSITDIEKLIFSVKKTNHIYIRFYDIEEIYSDNQKILENSLIGNEDYFTIMFNDFSKVEDFVLDIRNNVSKNIEIDQTIIENKKNFQFFSKLIDILSYALIAFSILSIIFFITNLLLAHIQNNKKNLGTLKAFGFSNSYIIVTYSIITMVLILVCFILSYILSMFSGNLFLDIFTQSSTGYLQQIQYENYPIITLLISMVIVPALFIMGTIFSYLYKVTPGDLIYERK
tara:strand:- start:918 stop:2441 length:1524 start_codon:yes stop_codon:yes gene_type:complete